MTSRSTKLSTFVAALAATAAVGAFPALAEGAQTPSTWTVNHPLLGPSNQAHAGSSTRHTTQTATPPSSSDLLPAAIGAALGSGTTFVLTLALMRRSGGAGPRRSRRLGTTPAG